MTREFLILLRQWVMAETEYACASREEDEEGYHYVASHERKLADELFEEMVRMTEETA